MLVCIARIAPPGVIDPLNWHVALTVTSESVFVSVMAPRAFDVRFEKVLEVRALGVRVRSGGRGT